MRHRSEQSLLLAVTISMEMLFVQCLVWARHNAQTTYRLLTCVSAAHSTDPSATPKNTYICVQYTHMCSWGNYGVCFNFQADQTQDLAEQTAK